MIIQNILHKFDHTFHIFYIGKKNLYDVPVLDIYLQNATYASLMFDYLTLTYLVDLSSVYMMCPELPIKLHF